MLPAPTYSLGLVNLFLFKGKLLSCSWCDEMSRISCLWKYVTMNPSYFNRRNIFKLNLPIAKNTEFDKMVVTVALDYAYFWFLIKIATVLITNQKWIANFSEKLSCIVIVEHHVIKEMNVRGHWPYFLNMRTIDFFSWIECPIVCLWLTGVGWGCVDGFLFCLKK